MVFETCIIARSKNKSTSDVFIDNNNAWIYKNENQNVESQFSLKSCGKGISNLSQWI